MDISIGKLFLKNCPQIMSQEDLLTVKLRELKEDYDKRTQLGIVPFYQDRLDHIQKQINETRQRVTHKPHEIQFLETHYTDTAKKLEAEKGELNAMAHLIYETWKDIQQIRTQ